MNNGIETAERFHGAVVERIDVCRFAHIAFDRDGLTTAPGDLRDERVGPGRVARIVADHRESVCCKTQCHGLANAAEAPVTSATFDAFDISAPFR